MAETKQHPHDDSAVTRGSLVGFVGHDVAIQGASRTDAGVHARGQLAAVTVQHPAQLSGMIKAVNTKLTRQIAVRDPVQVHLDYNPRFGNKGKAYSYHIYTDTLRRPLLDRWATRCPWLLNLEDMNRAAGYCTGTHDFTSFAAADGSHKTAVRTIDKFSCTASDTGLIRFDVRGTAFMKNMVRILVGTMLEVGRGRIPACDPSNDCCRKPSGGRPDCTSARSLPRRSVC